MTVGHNEQLTLAEMRTGQTGTVVGVLTGYRLIGRLDALGIRPGKKVTKVSSGLFHGPITVRVDNAQVAVGFGMATKIMIRVDRYLPRPS
ncbi:MAG: FeoA family protein [Dehalococcoidia bacterium]